MVSLRGPRRALIRPKRVIVSSGGGSAAVAFLAGNQSAATGTDPWVTSSISFSTGVVVLGTAQDRGGGGTAITAPTINGVTSTQIGTTISDGTTNGVSLWYASVSSGTGSISIPGGQSLARVFAAWMLTGLTSSTPDQTAQTNGFAVAIPDPQIVTLTSLAGSSVVVAFIGRNFPTADQNPTTWSGVTRNSGAEQTDAASNGAICAGGSVSSQLGTVIVTATGAGGTGWLYSGLIAVAFH